MSIVTTLQDVGFDIKLCKSRHLDLTARRRYPNEIEARYSIPPRPPTQSSPSSWLLQHRLVSPSPPSSQGKVPLSLSVLYSGEQQGQTQSTDNEYLELTDRYLPLCFSINTGDTSGCSNPQDLACLCANPAFLTSIEVSLTLRFTNSMELLTDCQLLRDRRACMAIALISLGSNRHSTMLPPTVLSM